VQLAFRILGLAARLLLALGAVCFLLGGYLAWRTQSFARDAVTVTGTVVSYQEVRAGTEVRYRPRVRFETPTGEIATFSGQMAATSRRFAIGTPVPVTYKVGAPAGTARLATFTDNWLGACVAAVVGLVSFAAGFLLRRSARREASS
jgi:hypothetical protein